MRTEVIICPACSHKLRVPEDLMGMPVECPQCHANFVAPPPPPTGEGAGPPAAAPVPATTPLPRPDDVQWGPSQQNSVPGTPGMKRVAPGLALIAIAVLQGAYYGFELISVVVKPDAARQSFEDSQQAIRNMGLPAQKPPIDPVQFTIAVLSILALVSLVQGLGGLALMRGKFLWLAIAGSVVSLINCMAFPCCLLGMPIGLWALIVLAQADVRASFS